MDFTATATTEEDVLVNLAPLTARGNKSVLDGPPTVTILEGDGTFTIVDEFNIRLHNTGVVTGVNNKYLIDGDPDLGPNKGSIQDTVTVTVTGALAVTNGITLSNVAKA